MAFAKRLYTAWTDSLGISWDIEIQDESGAVASSFLGGATPLSFRFGPGGDLDTPVKDTECTVTLIETPTDDYSWLITDNDRKVKIVVKIKNNSSAVSHDSLAIAEFVTKSLVINTGLFVSIGRGVSLIADSSNYMTGTVLSYDKNTGALSVAVTSCVGSGTFSEWNIVFVVTPILYYTGWLLPKQYLGTFGANNQLSITFSDQLRLISSKKFLNDNGIYAPTGLDTLLNQIQRALASTGLSLYLNVAINLFRSDMLTSSYEDPLDQANLDQDIWVDDNYEPGNCGDILSDIISAIPGCRIFQCMGEWWIVRLKECIEGTQNPLYRKFNPAGAVVFYGNMEAPIHTIFETGVRNFMVYGGELSFISEWQERDLEIDYGLRQSLIASLNVDTFWIDDHTHRYWENEGDVWYHLNSGEYAFIKAYTNQRTAFNPLLQLHSPSFNVVKDATYTLTVFCGRNRSNWPKNPCPVVLELTVGATIYNYDDKNSEWHNVGSSSYIPLEGITFQKIGTDVIGKNLLSESVTTAAIPDNGTIVIRFYAPYKGTSLNDNNYYYLGDVTFKRTEESDTLPNGEVSGIIINEDSTTIPDPLPVKINGGDVLRAEGTIETDRYLGIIVKPGAVENVDSWSEIGEYAPAKSQKLKEWIFDWWVDQHSTVSRVYNGSFRGLAFTNSVFQISEFGNRYFVWDDVEYDVYRGIWEGTVIELKTIAENYPTSTLRFGTLPKGGVLQVAAGAGTITKPGGATTELQVNVDGEFSGAEQLTVDPTTGRLLKGGTLPLCEYRCVEGTSEVGETTFLFDEPLLETDDVGVPPVIWGKNADGYPVPGVVTNDSEVPKHLGFKINFNEVCTFVITIIIKR